MDKLEIDEFEGLYTNVDERRLNPKFLSEALNVRFRTGYIESEGYLPSSVDLPADVIYCSPVRLDEDRWGNKVEDDELIRDYKQQFSYSLLTICEAGYGVKAFYLDNVLIPYRGQSITNFQEVYKVLEQNGALLIFTDKGNYWLGKINRETVTGQFERYDGYYLTDYIYYDYGVSYDIEEGKFEDIPIDGNLRLLKYTNSYVYDDNGNPILSRNYEIEARYSNDRYYKTFFLRGLKDSTGIWKIATSGVFKSKDWDEFILDVEKKDGTVWSSNITIDDILTPDVLLKFTTVQEDRFSHKKSEIVVTYVFDNLDEYVVSYRTYETDSLDYVLKLTNIDLKRAYYKSPFGADSMDWRITGVNIYIRKSEKDDFEQAYSFNFNIGKKNENLFSTVLLYKYILNGVYLSQTIGYLYDSKNYKPLKDIRDYINIQGISFCSDGIRIYYPAVGSGQIMNGVFYDFIPEVEGQFLANVNGDLGVFSTKLDLISIQDSKEGYLLFSPKDSLNFKIRDRYDLATSPEGIIIHTERGIYVTNGYERKLISEQINDVIERNFGTGNIFYDRNTDILFYLCQEGYYRYDFVYGKWNRIYLPHKGLLTFGFNGEIYYFNEGQLERLLKTSNIPSLIRTPSVDLDFPNIAKSVTLVDIDFEGEIWYKNYYLNHTSRKTIQLGIPVTTRTPSATLGIEFAFKGRVYSIDIFYDILGEFRNADFIPPSEAYPEGLPKTPELIESFKKALREEAGL